MIAAAIETKAVHLHYCKKNDSRKQLLDRWYLFTVISKSPWMAGKEALEWPAINRGFLCFKARDAKSAITLEETAAAGRMHKIEWNPTGTFPSLIYPEAHYQTADYNKEHKVETIIHRRIWGLTNLLTLLTSWVTHCRTLQHSRRRLNC